jgi:ribonuclease HI
VSTPAEHQLALDIISLANRAGMPDTYWSKDSRIDRACAVLGISPIQARDLPADVYVTGLPVTDKPRTAETPHPTAIAQSGTGLEVWTDGACAGNPGPGGWGWITNEEQSPRSGYGPDPQTTNQRMEILAVIEALTDVAERPITVVTDSRYVLDCATKGWWKGWIKKNWLNSQGQPVKNRDLWERFIPLVSGNDVAFRWVKGHAGHVLNEAADRLAVQGRDDASRAKRR